MATAGASAEETGMDFEALGLYPGSPMQLQAVAEVLQPHHWVKYVGCIDQCSVLTTLPLEEGKGMWMQPGQTFVVRGFNGRQAYAFSAQVLRARADPYAYLHLSWPRTIEIQPVRNALRVGVVLPVNVLKADGGSVAATLVDVSISGAMLDSALPVGAVGDKVHAGLSINLDGNAVRMDIPALIRSVHPGEDGKGCVAGLEFSGMGQNDRLILNYFIDSLGRNG